MSTLTDTVSTFLAERADVIRAIENCPTTNMEDYYRWQGHAEARRVLRESLERAGIDLTTEPRPEATIKAEALREAATAAREEAANSRTPQGHAEATTYADWLDDRATEIDPARLEGAHP